MFYLSSSSEICPSASVSHLMNISRKFPSSYSLVSRFAKIEQMPRWNTVVFANVTRLALRSSSSRLRVFDALVLADYLLTIQSSYKSSAMLGRSFVSFLRAY